MSAGDKRVSRIAIFGKGRELWPVAALLGKSLPSEIELVAVEEPDTDQPAPLTIRLDDPLFSRLGISAEQLQDTDSAIFALGTELRDWRGEGSRFFLAGSGTLPAVENIAIHQIMLRAALTHDHPDRLAYLYQPFRLPARIAEAGKFALQSPDPRSPLSMLRPTVQITGADYAALLKKRRAIDRIDKVEACPAAVRLVSDRGLIGRIELDNGGTVDADLFVDVSGALSELAGPGAASDWHSLFEALPFDRLLSAPTPDMPSASDHHSVAQAVAGGLLVTTALRRSSMTQLVYASSVLSDAAAKDLLGADAEAAAFAPGYAGQAWTGNLVRLGSASADFGPWLCGDTTLLNRQACLLDELIPVGLDMTVEAREFNRRHLLAAGQVGDFIQLPFVLNGRSDAPWCGMANSHLSENLAIRLEQFRSRGRFVAFEGEIYDEQSWIDLMIGFGVVPERYDPMAEALDMGVMARRLKNLASAFDGALTAVPDFRDEPLAPGAPA